jgi:16S rRNA A1518/A1519 N6-dimethyltransferase RsmA/KsgA/DIM1 with predicted DNA glycosylase/AP lyase activity
MTTKSVIKMLEDNRKTMQSLRNNNDTSGTSMEEDARPVVEIIEEILAKEAWNGQRASKLEIDDFLQLLSEFNEAGIHFC